MKFRECGRVSPLLCGLLIAAISLNGCGGGGERPSPNAVQSSSVVNYASAQTSAAPAKPAPSSDALALVSAEETTRQFAVSALNAAANPSNATVSPALMASHVNTLFAAAHGSTLAELAANFRQMAPNSATGLWLTQSAPVSRQLWAQRGQSFLLSFLDQTRFLDQSDPTKWQAGETGFADQSASSDTAANLAMSKAGSDLSAATFGMDTRLVVIDAIKPHLAWPAASTFDGRFLNEAGTMMYKLPMVRVTQDVVQHIEPTFVANALTVNGLTTMTITPSTGSLSDFLNQSRLSAAIKASVAAFAGKPSSTLPAGQIVLPAGDLRLPFDGSTKLASLAYDESLADFKSLDGQGGTYMSVTSSASHLLVDANGLTLNAALAQAFVFSRRNVNGPGNSGGVNSYLVSFTDGASWVTQACTATPDMRSQFLVILDAQHAVISLSAISAPGGVSVPCN
jgi:hypothetical protein